MLHILNKREGQGGKRIEKYGDKTSSLSLYRTSSLVSKHIPSSGEIRKYVKNRTENTLANSSNHVILNFQYI